MEHEAIPVFETVFQLENSVALVRASGEVDLSNVDRLAACVSEACATDRPVVFDFHGLRYCDSSAIHVLVETARSCAARGVSISVRGAHGSVRRILEITDLVDVLNVEAE
jgi:anti-sigma B factor antagonist